MQMSDFEILVVERGQNRAFRQVIDKSGIGDVGIKRHGRITPQAFNDCTLAQNLRMAPKEVREINRLSHDVMGGVDLRRLAMK